MGSFPNSQYHGVIPRTLGSFLLSWDHSQTFGIIPNAMGSFPISQCHGLIPKAMGSFLLDGIIPRVLGSSQSRPGTPPGSAPRAPLRKSSFTTSRRRSSFKTPTLFFSGLHLVFQSPSKRSSLTSPHLHPPIFTFEQNLIRFFMMRHEIRPEEKGLVI